MKHTKNFTIIATMLLQLADVTNLLAANVLDSLAKQKSCFYSAKQELNDMLSGKIPLDYERAIFIIENAYWENTGDYSLFQIVISSYIENVEQLIKNNRDYSKQNFKPTLLETEEQKKAKYEKALTNWSVFSYMTDTILFMINQKIYHHLPFQYSTKDPLGTLNWANTQVFNLLGTRKGNCFALTALFKIFSERLNSEANICTAPGHIYLRHADHKGIYYNIELATRSFPGTGSMEVLTYTTDAATKNGISLRELDLKQSVALCLVYLAKGFEYKFGLKDDDFLMQCAELALQYDSLNLNAMLLRTEVQEQKIIAKNKSVAELQTDKQFKEYENHIVYLYKLGYREMPLEMKNIIIAGLRKDTLPVIVKNHTPQPFKNLGVTDTRYATLSWGLFDEMHEEKPFEQYSRTVFDTKKKKISKFVIADILYNQYNFDPVVFAWSVDPLAKKYPQLSPYSAFGNNPILFIDEVGQEIRLHGSNDFKQLILSQLQLLTNDKLIINEQGLVQIHEPGLTASTRKFIGTSLVSELVSSSKVVNVEQITGLVRTQTKFDKSKAEERISTGSTILINIELQEAGLDVTGKISVIPLQIKIGHELGHASDLIRGTLDLSPADPTQATFNPNAPGFEEPFSKAEIKIMKLENILRKEQGVILRASPVKKSIRVLEEVIVKPTREEE